MSLQEMITQPYKSDLRLQIKWMACKYKSSFSPDSYKYKKNYDCFKGLGYNIEFAHVLRTRFQSWLYSLAFLRDELTEMNSLR